MNIIIIMICFLCSPLLHATVLSFDSEDLPFGQEKWSFQVEGVKEVYSLKAQVYPPTKIQVNFWDSKEIPDNLMIFPQFMPIQVSIRSVIFAAAIWII